MNIKEKVVAKGFETAISSGQKSFEKLLKTIIEQEQKILEEQAEIIDRINWIMITQQKVCNNLKIKLKDPLEEE
jgi:hypothetical protein